MSLSDSTKRQKWCFEQGVTPAEHRNICSSLPCSNTSVCAALSTSAKIAFQHLKLVLVHQGVPRALCRTHLPEPSSCIPGEGDFPPDEASLGSPLHFVLAVRSARGWTWRGREPSTCPGQVIPCLQQKYLTQGLIWG